MTRTLYESFNYDEMEGANLAITRPFSSKRGNMVRDRSLRYSESNFGVVVYLWCSYFDGIVSTDGTGKWTQDPEFHKFHSLLVQFLLHVHWRCITFTISMVLEEYTAD